MKGLIVTCNKLLLVEFVVFGYQFLTKLVKCTFDQEKVICSFDAFIENLMNAP
jgi:hypothetical protein